MDILQIAKILTDDITYNNGLVEDAEQQLLNCPIAKLKPVKDIDYNKQQLKKGTKEEGEHTTNQTLAKIIAKHHLGKNETNNEKYYTELEKVEKKLDREEANK
jgi:hypothetical protein